jgi:uncharacterized membrane-anchored protein YitT (DUF2179 family)
MLLIGAPRRPEIDQYTIKFLIGAIALALPFIELALTRGSITSISASFWVLDPDVWPRIIFVGFLFAISAFLLAYNGLSETEMWLGKVASVSALGVALFPCACEDKTREIFGGVHLALAGSLFIVLAWFCVIFMRRAKAKGNREAQWRAAIYKVCGWGMVASAVLFIARAITKQEVLAFWGETVGLVSFGASWLTASRVLPVITPPSERQRLVVSTSRQTTPDPAR